MPYRAAVVGTGSDPEHKVSGTTHSWGFHHGAGYREDDRTDLVACCDLDPEAARAFAAEYGIPEDAVFTDYRAMLREVDPDIVSVCTPTTAHCEVVIGCAESGVPEAIHCEKPMARTWGEARLMAYACDRRGVSLTFGHQRRFAEPFREAKALLDRGAIGDLRRIETSWGNLHDNGTHSVDLCNYFADEAPAEWVLGQLDYRTEHVRYGVHHANQGLALWEYGNGVHAMLSVHDGPDQFDRYSAFDCWHRLLGEEGTIEVGAADAPPLRYRADGSDWQPVDVEADFAGDVGAAVSDAVTALEDPTYESPLRARNALNVTEILFAVAESSRRRGRVDLPLDVDDNPLEAMVEAGVFDLEPAEREEMRAGYYE
jgi:predicted dehydrogenase